MDEWPIVGRDHELLRIGRRLVEPAPHGVRPGSLIVGVPGVGKTRFARELYRHVRRHRQNAVWATASRTAQHQPLGAFAGFAPDGDDSFALLGRLAAELSPGDRQTTVFVDDVHALDPLSALLVQALAHRPRTTLLLTARVAEPLPDVIVDLWKDDVLERLEITPLDEHGTAALASAILERPLDPLAARRLWERSRGNPLYITHIAQDWRNAGISGTAGGVDAAGAAIRAAPTAHGDDDRLPFLPDPAGRLPAELGALIEQTTIALEPAALEVLDSVSLLEPFPAAAIADVVPAADARLLETLEARGVIAASADDPGGTVMLRAGHPLFAEARREAMGTLRARRLRTRILAAVDRTGVEIDIVARALLSLQSDGAEVGGTDTAGDAGALQFAAAATAFARLDLDLTARLARASIARGGPPEATTLAAYALSLRSRGQEAAELLAPLVDAPRPPVDALIVESGNRFFVLRDPSGAIDRTEAAMAATPDEWARAELGAMLAWEFAFQARPADALEAAADALRRTDLSARGVATASIARVTALACLGRVDEVGEIAEAAYPATEGGFAAAVMRTVLLDAHQLALHLAGRMGDAARLADSVLAGDRDVPPPFDGRRRNLIGRSLVRCGRIAEGVAVLNAVQAAIDHDLTGWAPLNLLDLAEAAALGGDREHAAAYLDRARAAWLPSFRYRDPQLARIAALVDAAAGRTAAAVEGASAAADLAVEQDAPALAIRALHDAVRYGAHDLGDRLRALADGVDGPRAVHAPRHADAWDRGDAAALDELSLAYERESDLVMATDAAAQAAVHWASAGRGGRAAAARLRIRGLEATTGRLHTPAVERAELGPSLSEREAEIAALIVGGHSDRDIAARLGLSTRTVEGHAHRIYAKLGVEGRAQLRAAGSGGSTGTGTGTGSSA
ncbi:helix-turn-helix transcriptional regulator [Agromyces sp. NPDC055520]